MSTMAKVFTVVVLMLAVAQASIYSTIFYHRINWRKNYEDLRKDYERLARHKDALIRVREKRIQMLQKLISDYRENLITVRNQAVSEVSTNLALKSQLAEKTQQVDVLMQDLSQITAQIQSLSNTISELRRRNQDLNEKYQQARRDQDLINQTAARLKQYNVDLENDLAELRRQYLAERKAREALQLKLDALRERGYPVDQVLAEELAPPIKCEVVAVMRNIQPNLVLLSAGENMKVKKGYKFTIYRGNEFIAQVVVEKVLPRFAGARVLYQRKPIEMGDRAATQLE